MIVFIFLYFSLDSAIYIYNHIWWFYIIIFFILISIIYDSRFIFFIVNTYFISSLLFFIWLTLTPYFYNYLNIYSCVNMCGSYFYTILYFYFI